MEIGGCFMLLFIMIKVGNLYKDQDFRRFIIFYNR
jgi:hypothetical protein